jgi:hypothetical protein
MAAELLFDFEKLLGGGVESFIPGDPLPFTLSPLSHSFHGMLDTVGTIDILYHGIASITDTAPVKRAIGIPLNLDQFPILDMGQ